MKRIGLFLCAAILMTAGMAVSEAFAQSYTGRALFAYPMQGQTPEQENADRAECHDWAVAQSGFDPARPPDVRSGVLAGRAINAQPGPTGSGRGIGSGVGGTLTNAERRQMEELHDSYLRAATVCLEGRGYQVSR